MGEYSLRFLFCGYLLGTITSPTVPSKNTTIITTTAPLITKNVSLPYNNYTGPPPTIPPSWNATDIPPSPNNYTGPPPTGSPSVFMNSTAKPSPPPGNYTGKPSPTENTTLSNKAIPTTPQKSAASTNATTVSSWKTTTTVYQYQNASNTTNPSNGSDIVYNATYVIFGNNGSNDYFYDFDGSNGNASSFWTWIWGNWGQNYENRHKNNDTDNDDDDYYHGWRRWLWHVLGAFLTAIFIVGCLCCLCGVCECVTSCCCCCCKGNDQVYNDPQTSKKLPQRSAISVPPGSAYMPPPRVMEPQICSPGMIVPYNMAYGGPPSYDPFDDPNQVRIVRVSRVSYL
ncbi:unnamed protein product, partial [Mesorhabditis belari]|uniref:Uncharacterized protein n=1 Tax=Mesorhabditis belari TaxID=2138241 RepID=A0AAF3F820_9BILA